jgi:amino acid transporter
MVHLPENKTDMRKVIVTYGIIGGLIVSAIMFGTQPLMHKGSINMENGMVIGYASMVIALSMVFFGIKTYRDKHLNGAIKFGKAFQVGIIITLIASCMYGLAWEVCYNTFASNFMEAYTQSYLEKMASEGATVEAIAAKKAEMQTFGEWYKNPLVRFGATLVEILPVGLLITLLSAALLRKSNFLPENVQA